MDMITLPFVKGESMAENLNIPEAVARAVSVVHKFNMMKQLKHHSMNIQMHKDVNMLFGLKMKEV